MFFYSSFQAAIFNKFELSWDLSPAPNNVANSTLIYPTAVIKKTAWKIEDNNKVWLFIVDCVPENMGPLTTSLTIGWTRTVCLQKLFGTLIIKTIGHQQMFLFSHLTCSVQLFYVEKLSRSKYHEFSFTLLHSQSQPPHLWQKALTHTPDHNWPTKGDGDTKRSMIV